MSEAHVYQIHITDHLDESWADWFSPLVVVNEANGDAKLTGAVRDQAELHGLLQKVFDLNLTLLAVNRMMDPSSECPFSLIFSERNRTGTLRGLRGLRRRGTNQPDGYKFRAFKAIPG